jgi:ribonuclease P protein component
LASGASGPAAERSQGFGPSDRLRKRFEFRFVRDRGRRVHTKNFLVLIARSESERTRLGITVSRQCGNAVRRNRIKRLVRETFRQHRSLFPDHADLVVIAKSPCSVAGLSDVHGELSQAAHTMRHGRGRR